ncbi:MAG: quinolinate synthase NadA [Methanomicrobiaceae archaeon]|nr:quinolinate synthase NadA [Methanomicrobiaceae archaeon]
MGIREEIEKLRKEKNAVILAHNYQPPEIQDLAGITGDSLELAIKAKEATEDIIVFCGVEFMAETAKILNPGKKVIMPVKDAGCPLADQLTPEMIREARKKHPGAAVVVYVNSSAECKAEADVACTSANAAGVVRSLTETEIIFGPDSNLGSWVQEQVPEKKIIPVPPDGHCPVHAVFEISDAEEAKKKEYCIVCHPECEKKIRDASDFVASTGGMLKIAHEADKWAVFTEKDMAYRLKKEFPDKEFRHYEKSVCIDMKKITPQILRDSLKSEEYEVIIDEDIMNRARGAIERMIKIRG